MKKQEEKVNDRKKDPELDLFGFKKNPKYVRNYFHEANIRSSIYMAAIIIVLEIWMIIRQFVKYVGKFLSYDSVKYKAFHEAGYTKSQFFDYYYNKWGYSGHFEYVFNSISFYLLFIIAAVGVLVYAISFIKKNAYTKTKKYDIASIIVSVLCILWIFMLIPQKIPTDNIGKWTTILMYIAIFVLGVAIFISTMYSSFMNKGIAELYLFSQYKQSKLSVTPLEKKILLTKEEIDNIDDSKIKKRIYHIFYRLLKNFDIELYNELINKVEPEYFLFKWYLCFLTREFNINKVIHLWDLIFCYDFIDYNLMNSANSQEYHFHVIDSISLSMIINCKSDLMKLKEENDSKFLELLMHYPEKIKIEQIIKEALKIESIINPNKNIDSKNINENFEIKKPTE